MAKEKYLREEFTGYMIKLMLENRISINLIGDKGTGKTRLLEDICSSGLTGVKIVRVDLKAYENTYSGLLREMHSQLGLKGEIPPKLGEIFAGFENHQDKYLILMDNYDALLDNPQVDQGYDVGFFDDLNYIKNKKNIALLCATSRPHNALPVFIAGKSFRNSWLDLQKENLPPLDRSQIEKELDRRLADPVRRRFKDQPHEHDLLVAAIHKKPYPYARLCFLVKKMNNQGAEGQPIKFKKRLKKWLNEKEKLERRGIDKQGHRLKQWRETKRIAFGLKEPKIPIISKLINRLLNWLLGGGK
ncbi:MAG: ATP-binding protein [Candidatus Aminicenantes bacterium]|nr:ATP-binding protein [Candidatus Aminicenantes bacterium]